MADQPIDGRWYWVRKRPECFRLVGWFAAKRDHTAAGGWRIAELWEDVFQEIGEWQPMAIHRIEPPTDP